MNFTIKSDYHAEPGYPATITPYQDGDFRQRHGTKAVIVI